MPQTFDSRDYDDLLAKYYTPANGGKRILAEGDSWFAYPRRFLLFGKDANIIDWLAERNNLVIYNTSSNGDEAVAMLSGDQKFSLIKRLKHTEFDYLLFSGGGNDVVGRFDFDFFVQEKQPGGTWRTCIRDDRLALKIGQIEAVYRMLCELVGEHSKNPNIRVVTHTYEELTPNPEGYELFDLVPIGKSWIYPFLMEKQIDDPADQKAIVAHMLSEFAAALHRVEAAYPSLLKVVDTHGAVPPGEWRNEIHPTSAGFRAVADRIYQQAIAV